MYGWDTTNKLIQLHIKQMLQESEHDRLVRVVTSGRAPKRAILTEALGHALILIGSRLTPNESQADPVGNAAVVFPVSTACCGVATGQCATC